MVKSRGCDCVNSTCKDSFRLSEGWHNQTLVEPFFGDIIDTSTDGAADDTDESISSFVAALEGMPCSSSVLNVDGTCNEPNRKSSGAAPHSNLRTSYLT